MESTSRCITCKLKDFCAGDREQNFYDEMWKRHAKLLSKEFAKEMKDNLPRKAKYRKDKDKSKYKPRCYYAVLLYHAIKDKCLDHYTGDQYGDIDWSKAQKGGKDPDAPAIDHINSKDKKALLEPPTSPFAAMMSMMQKTT